jgi:16S rRNA (guanine(966)-N(2))-methyltransferase RsmD
MRVIGGTARGRQLANFVGQKIRPTPDRVKEALFSMLFSKRGPLTGQTVLDLFAGSGSLGIEALSRGAGHAWFVDRSRQAIDIIRQNLESCRLADRATTIMTDVWQGLPSLGSFGPFNLIFADPPYGGEHVSQLLQEIDRLGLLAVGGLFCLETASTDPVADHAGTLRRVDHRRYGTTMIHFFDHSPGELRV